MRKTKNNPSTSLDKTRAQIQDYASRSRNTHFSEPRAKTASKLNNSGIENFETYQDFNPN